MVKLLGPSRAEGLQVARVARSTDQVGAWLEQDFAVPYSSLGNMSAAQCAAYSRHVERTVQQAEIAKVTARNFKKEAKAVAAINEAVADIAERGLKTKKGIDGLVSKGVVGQARHAGHIQVITQKTRNGVELAGTKTRHQLSVLSQNHQADNRLLGARAAMESRMVQERLRTGLRQVKSMPAQQQRKQEFTNYINGRSPQGGVGGGGFWGGVGRLLGFA